MTRKEIYLDIDKRGKVRAYRWSRLQFRCFPMKLAEAETLIASGEAIQLPHHPFRGPRG